MHHVRCLVRHRYHIPSDHPGTDRALHLLDHVKHRQDFLGHGRQPGAVIDQRGLLSVDPSVPRFASSSPA